MVELDGADLETKISEQFPNSEYQSYLDYYEKNYNLKIKEKN